MAVNIFEHDQWRSYLQSLIRERESRQRAFTLSQWSKKLGYRSPRSIGMVINGTRLPTSQMLDAISREERHNLAEKRCLALLVEIEKRRARARDFQDLAHELAGLKIRAIQKEEVDASQVFGWGNWYMPAIYSLVGQKDFRGDAHWIRKRLRNKVSENQVHLALQALIAQKWIVKTESPAGYAQMQSKHVVTRPMFPSALVREQNRQMIALAMDSFEEQPVGLRLPACHTFGIKRENIPAAIQFLNQALDELVSRFEDSSGEHLYQANFQFFDLSQPAEDEGES